ncbi:MAG: hypothetical protein CML46_12085 [Rhodobacteraceae bacterium]|nr:hypothetical protein [Paracoccaceae bacterium]
MEERRALETGHAPARLTIGPFRLLRRARRPGADRACAAALALTPAWFTGVLAQGVTGGGDGGREAAPLPLLDRDAVCFAVCAPEGTWDGCAAIPVVPWSRGPVGAMTARVRRRP